jgi:NAD(P)-dependent dehydrogenase (short-subunit alcohol dehydrogenase family)
MAPERSQDNLGTVLVTGGTDGLGRAAAILLAERGYRVFAGGRNADRRAALEKFAREKTLPLELLDMDVCDDASVSNAVGEIERRAGPVNILVNNAGIAIGAMIEEIKLADLRKQFETNFFGAIRVAQRVLPLMRQQRRGRIINMSSIAGKVAVPVMGPYSSSKHALEAASDALRLELFPFGVHVVLIEPGYIPTSMNQNATELSSAYIQGGEQSPYRGVYLGFQNVWKKAMESAHDTPEDCARVILRAIEDEPPRARYLVTNEAKIANRMKWLLPDRIFDGGLVKRLGLGAVRDAMKKEAAK